MKNIFVVALATTTLFSCGNGSRKLTKNTGEVMYNIDADSELNEETRQELKRQAAEVAESQKKEAQEQAEKEAQWTSLEFNKKIHDFGKVPKDTDVFTEFVVTNTGDKPLVIDNVSASCGCTMPKKPEAPILPGQSDIIEVKFHSKPGQEGVINKTVSVSANTAEGIHKVEIKAFVF